MNANDNASGDHLDKALRGLGSKYFWFDDWLTYTEVSNFSKDLRQVIAKYAIDCQLDTKIAQQNFEILNENLGPLE